MKVIEKKKILLICFFIILILIFFLFCYYCMVKKMKIGNNKSSQEMVYDILNIKSYEAVIEVVVKSNKNQNKYLIKQKYNGENSNYQEVIEPSNIRGVRIVKTNKELKIENTNLNLVSIFENYEYLSENHLDLNNFISDYKQYNNSRYKEKQEEIIMETLSKTNFKIKKSLYINKKTEKPIKLEIDDTNKKTSVYILYREVNINS